MLEKLPYGIQDGRTCVVLDLQLSEAPITGRRHDPCLLDGRVVRVAVYLIDLPVLNSPDGCWVTILDHPFIGSRWVL